MSWKQVTDCQIHRMKGGSIGTLRGHQALIGLIALVLMNACIGYRLIQEDNNQSTDHSQQQVTALPIQNGTLDHSSIPHMVIMVGMAAKTEEAQGHKAIQDPGKTAAHMVHMVVERQGTAMGV